MNFLIALATALMPLALWKLPGVALPLISIALLLSLPYLQSADKPLHLRQRLLSGFGLLLAGLLLAVPGASSQSHAGGILIGWIILPAVFACLLAAGTSRQKTLAAGGLLIGFCLTAVAAAGSLLGWYLLWPGQVAADLSQYLHPLRAIGPFTSPNTLAMFMLPLGLLLLGGHFKQPVRWFIGTATLLTVLASRSDGGLLAMALAPLSAWLLMRYPKKRLFTALGLLLLVGLAMTQADSRFPIWQGALQLLKQPRVALFGLSDGGFQAAYANLVQGDPQLGRYVVPYALHPHNLFLASWFNAGLFGVIGLTVLFWLALLAALKRPRSVWTLAALLAILIHGAVDTTFWQASLAPLSLLIMADAFWPWLKPEKHD